MKNLIILIVLFILSAFYSEAGAGAGTFPQGDHVKQLKDKIEFKNSYVQIITNDSDDPTVVSKTATIGSIYIKADDGKIYTKTDTGDSTNWDIVLNEADLTEIKDTDGDTKVDTEASPDEDIVHVTVGGTEVATFTGTGIMVNGIVSQDLTVTGSASIGATISAVAFVGDGSALTGLSSGFSNPMTTIGDLIFKNSGNITTRLPVGTASQVLTSDGANVSWENASSGFSDPLTTRGDLIYRDSGNITARLPLGNSGYVLASDGSDLLFTDLGISTITASVLQNTNDIVTLTASADNHDSSISSIESDIVTLTASANNHDIEIAALESLSSDYFLIDGTREVTGDATFQKLLYVNDKVKTEKGIY